MPDCPNCAAEASGDERLCPSCGFDLQSRQAEDVRRLREEGKIHPGRINAQDPGAPGGTDRAAADATAPSDAPDTRVQDPRQAGGGL